jgi:hypothetical protein
MSSVAPQARAPMRRHMLAERREAKAERRALDKQPVRP